ncbi:ketopantoate reductase PanE/ApbA C terminal-domain-containing protein, partial [Dactylonectria estremocensis]
PRVSARLPQRLSRCLRHSASASRRAPARCFASAASPTHQTTTPKDISPDIAGLPSNRPWSIRDQSAQIPVAASSTPPSKFHIPSVIIPAEAARSGPAHKIHILGDDVRSRFIAHALCGVYDSVELLGYRSMPKSRYRNVEPAQQDRTRRTTWSEPNAAPGHQHVKTDKSHIDQLIVTGRGFEAVKAIHSVKDRVDETTSVCLLNDGMGVLEEVRDKVFKDTETTPNFILGHMSHALVYNRNRGSVKELMSGRTVLTQTNPTLDTRDFLDSLNQVKDLRTQPGSFEKWMRFKLPSMVFTAAVEPVCVLLETPYQAVLENRSAQSMMNQLLSEIVTVVENLPELDGATDLRRFIRGEGLKKWCYQRITGKASEPSDLLRRIEKGLQTDIKYQNGFFQRRAKALGIDMPTNSLMVQMVKARRAEAIAKRNSFIAIEEKSVDSLRASARRHEY